MKRILVVGEDALCCALGEKLVAAALPGWSLAGPAIDTKGVTKLIPALPRYSEQAQFVQPVLCIADTDGQCVKQWLQKNVPARSHKNMLVRTQPKMISMLVVQNSDGDVLLQKRRKQPYIEQWTLPYGKVHIDDETVECAALREAKEKLNVSWRTIAHAGDCYIRVYVDGEVFTSTIAHIFYKETDDIALTQRLQWVRPHKLNTYDLAPAVEQIVARTFFRDPYFFEEYTEELPL